MPALLMVAEPTASHTEVAYRTIKRRIIDLDLAPGSQFSEGELARVDGISKTPIREALVRLQRDGLVEAIPRSGYRVKEITLRSTSDLCAFRSIVEPKAAELAAARGVPAEMLERLETLLTRSLSTPWHETPEATEEYMRRHFEFDAIIANAADNRRLAAAIIGVLDDLERVLRLVLRILPWSEARVEERTAIFEALQRRDPPAAYAAMLQRTQGSEREILATLLKSSAISDANISLTV